MLNVDQPDYGHILDDMVLQDNAVFPVGELIQPKIEPEIAFILDRDLKGPGATPMQVLAATRFVVPALEIIDSRIEGWKVRLCDTIADNASSARVVLGSSPRRVDERDLKLVGMILEKNGGILQTGAGRGTRPSGGGGSVAGKHRGSLWNRSQRRRHHHAGSAL